MNAGNALDRRNAIALKQELEHQLGAIHGQVHAVQGVVTGIREDFAALLALVALAILTLPRLPTFGSAIVAGHMDLDLSSGQGQNGSGPRNPFLWLRLRLNPAGSFSYQRGLLLLVGGPGRAWTGVRSAASYCG